MVIFKTQRTVKFEECDPAGILFFNNYLLFAQSALGDYWLSRGKFNEFYANPDFTFPVYLTEGKYLKPAVLGAVLTIEISLTDKRESSAEFTFHFSIGALDAAHIKIVHVCVHKQSGAKTPLPEFFTPADY